MAFTYDTVMKDKMSKAKEADDAATAKTYERSNPPIVLAIKVSSSDSESSSSKEDPIQPKDSSSKMVTAKCPECQHVGLMEAC